MSNTTVKTATLPATLTLDDTVRLSGELSSLLDGRLQLNTVPALDDAGFAALCNLPVDALITLSIAQNPAMRSPPPDAKVTISRLYHDSITLEFAPSDTEVASYYRQAIANAQTEPNTK